MLSPVEMDFVRRDPAIPGLGVVLDTDAFVEAMRRAAPELDLRAAQITYVRYKPQAYCRAAYRLDLGGVELEVDVRACRPEDLESWIQQGQRASVPEPPGRAHMVHMVLERFALVISAFPNDPRLPGLQHLTNKEGRKRLLGELVPDQPSLWQGELRCLRYRPERRYVAELHAADGGRALLKSYTRRGYVRGKHNAVAFRSSEVLRVARLLGSSDSRCLLAFEWLPGPLLFDLCLAAQTDCQAVTSTGVALAQLHAQAPEGLSCWTDEAAAADLISLASEIGFLCPQLGRRADELARRLAAQLAVAPATHCAVHGDFSAKQVIVALPEVAIIDLDWACSGDPADDLGNFIAQAERYELRGELTRERVESLKDALLEGYRMATQRPLPERIGLYTAMGLFRRARFPFRAREPDWPQRTEGLLERAETILNP